MGRGRSALWAVLVSALLAATTSVVPAAADPPLPSPYPSSLPDFTHPGSPHTQLFSPTSGDLDRPMLVIYTQFSDVPVPPGQDAAWLQDRYFRSSYPSVADYFRSVSFGDLILRPAVEAQGTANDGVVVVNAGASSAYFNPPGLTGNAIPAFQLRRSITLADPFVNFAAFDDRGNGDGHVGNNELVIVNMVVNPATCTAARYASAGPDFDGKNLTTNLIAMATTGLNRMTEIHEVAHALTWMRDLYGFAVGSFALSGPTCGTAEPYHMVPNSWERLHLGWRYPTVVTRDGWYDIPRWDTTGRSFLLYDPARGPNDYVLVENRVPMAGTYDESAPDTGLLIWRIQEAFYNTQTEISRPVEILRPDGTRARGCLDDDLDGRIDEDNTNGVDDDRDGQVDEDPGNGVDDDGDGRIDEDRLDGRDNDGDGMVDEETATGGCYGGSNTDAWNPTDPSTPGATLQVRWQDRRLSGLAVRDIQPPGPGGTMRAYLDVRGPYGAQMDCYSGAAVRPVRPGEPNQLGFLVRNTGEVTDTIRVVVGPPAGWTTPAPPTVTLAPGASAIVNVTLTPPPFANVLVYAFDLTAQSVTDPSYSSGCRANAAVVLDRTEAQYVGVRQAPWGEPAGFRVRVTDPEDGGSPVPGAFVEFSLRGPLGGDVQQRLLTGAVTDAAGFATPTTALGAPPDLPTGYYDLVMRVGRSGRHAPTELTTRYLVLPHPTRLVLRGTSSGDYSDPVGMTAFLVDQVDGDLVPGRSVVFRVGAQSAVGTTDAIGMATGTIFLDQPAGSVTRSVEFAGTTAYSPAFTSGPFTIHRERVVDFDSDEQLTTETSPIVSAAAEEEVDAGPGDLSLAEATFTLVPTLGTAGFEDTVGLDAVGLGEVAPSGLEPDVYRIDVAVPDANPYWQGATEGAGELVVFDFDHVVGGEATAPTKGGTALLSLFVELPDKAIEPTGEVTLEVPEGTFTGSSIRWLVVNGTSAALEVKGSFEGRAATLRLVVRDLGAPVAVLDRFAATITVTGGAVYEVEEAMITGGNLFVG